MRMLFFPLDLFKQESFILAAWFSILHDADTEGKEATKMVYETCLPIHVYNHLGGLNEMTWRVQNCYVKLKQI